METLAIFGDLPTPKIIVSGHGQGLSDDLQRLGRLARPRVAVDGKVMVDPHPPWQFWVGQVLRNLQVMTPRVFINKRFTSASCYLLKIKPPVANQVFITGSDPKNQHHDWGCWPRVMKNPSAEARVVYVVAGHRLPSDSRCLPHRHSAGACELKPSHGCHTCFQLPADFHKCGKYLWKSMKYLKISLFQGWHLSLLAMFPVLNMVWFLTFRMFRRHWPPEIVGSWFLDVLFCSDQVWSHGGNILLDRFVWR